MTETRQSVGLSDDGSFSDEEGSSAADWERLPPERDFFASPYDPPIKSLVQEMADGDLDVRPSFQRYKVWDLARQSKFVESILLNIPIPTLFFAEDDDHGKVVVDGQQRLLALRDFMENEYPLQGLTVLKGLNGRRFRELTDRQQRMIKNRTLRCLVISAKSDSDIRFEVFERLNQGGVPLNAQEVRHCVIRGPLNDLLHDLVKKPPWLGLVGRTEPHPRMLDCELVLRFFGLRAVLPNYAPPLKGVLTHFMKAHRAASREECVSLTEAFESAISAVGSAFPEHPFRRTFQGEKGLQRDRSLNRAVFDCQMLVMEGMDSRWAEEHSKEIRESFDRLCLNDPMFQEAVSRATADKTRMRRRLSQWKNALLDLGATLPAAQRIPKNEVD